MKKLALLLALSISANTSSAATKDKATDTNTTTPPATEQEVMQFGQQNAVFRNAYVKPGKAGKNTAVYVEILLPEGAEATDVTIVEIAPRDPHLAENAALHGVDEEGRMIEVENLPIPATLQPGGHHLMLFGLGNNMEEGTEVVFVVRFSDGSTQEFVATVVKQD